MWGFYIEQLIHSLPFFLKGLWMTVAVSGLSLAGGTVIGFIWGIVRASASRSRFSKSLFGAWVDLIRGRGTQALRRAFLESGLILIGVWVDLIRGTPFLVQIFIIFFLFPEIGIQLEAFPAAVIALTNLAACFICEIVAAGIQAVPLGQKEAATSTGLNWFQQLRHVILPQSMRVILPPLVGQYVLLIKDSSVVSAIGVLDVTRVGWLTVQRVPQGLLVFGLVALLYFVICYPLIQLSNRLEKRMSVGYSRGKG